VILELLEGQCDQEGDSIILDRDNLLLGYRIDVRVVEGLKLLLELLNYCLNCLGIVIAEVLVEEVPVELDEKPQDWCLLLNQGRTVDIEGLNYLSQRSGWL
jgi:hypothetical protein